MNNMSRGRDFTPKDYDIPPQPNFVGQTKDQKQIFLLQNSEELHK
jgi:hypothetical protein